MLLPEEELEIFSEILTSSVCEKITPSLETEIPLSEVEILLSSEQTTLSLDLRSTLIHKIEDNLAIILLSGVIISTEVE